MKAHLKIQSGRLLRTPPDPLASVYNRIRVCLHTPHKRVHAWLTASSVISFSTWPVLFMCGSTRDCDVCVTNSTGNEHKHTCQQLCPSGHTLNLLCVLINGLRMWVGPRVASSGGGCGFSLAQKALLWDGPGPMLSQSSFQRPWIQPAPPAQAYSRAWSHRPEQQSGSYRD